METFEVKTRDGKPVPLSGHALAWSCSKKEYDRVNFVNSWEQFNLDRNIPQEFTRNEIFKRVVNSLKNSQGAEFIKEFKTADGSTAYKYFTVDVEGNDIVPTVRGTVWFDEASDLIHADNLATETKFREKMRVMATLFLQRDMTRYMLALFKKADIIPLRSAGGMYFVPIKHHELVKNAKAFFKDIDGGRFTIIEIPKTLESQETIKESFVDSLGSDLNLMKEKWEAIKEGGKNMSPTVFKNQMAEMKELASKLLLYKEVTEENLRESEEAIAAYEKAAMEFMRTGDVPKDLPEIGFKPEDCDQI